MAGEESFGVALFLTIALCIWALATFIRAQGEHKRNKTLTYRKNVNDLIVVGKMRQYAEANNVDLHEELAFFNDFNSKTDPEQKKDLDQKIEEEIFEETEHSEDEQKKK